MSRRAVQGVILALLTATALGACREQEPVLVVRTVPADAAVSVDGYAHPGESPHEIVMKAPGRYRLSVSQAGYRPVELNVSLAAGERVEQRVELVPEPDGPGTLPPDAPQIAGPNPPIEMPSPPGGAETFALHVTTNPSGAEVAVRQPGSPAERRVGASPVVVRLSDAGATEVTIRKRGYRTHRRLVVAPAGGGDVKLDVALARRTASDPPDPGPIAPDPPRPEPPIVAPGGQGYLSVSTIPWSAVHVDGKPRGNTPLVRLQLSAGRHTVLMENRDQGVRRKKTVTIRAGEHVRLVERLD